MIGLKSLIQAQEDENGETFQRMSHLANTLNIILVGIRIDNDIQSTTQKTKD
jgi:hypothetical protein